jgi:hypothetical protein
MNDAQLKLLAGQVLAASANGAGLDITGGVGGWNPAEGGAPMQCRIPVSTIKTSAGNETYQFKLQDSPDNATWTDISANRAASDYSALTTNGQEGSIYVGGFVRQAYVRLVATLGGTAPSITVGDCYLQPVTPHVG